MLGFEVMGWVWVVGIWCSILFTGDRHRSISSSGWSGHKCLFLWEDGGSFPPGSKTCTPLFI